MTVALQYLQLSLRIASGSLYNDLRSGCIVHTLPDATYNIDFKGVCKH